MLEGHRAALKYRLLLPVMRTARRDSKRSSELP
jgi:hypothetical protein